jgi:hypothetical protein
LQPCVVCGRVAAIPPPWHALPPLCVPCYIDFLRQRDIFAAGEGATGERRRLTAALAEARVKPGAPSSWDLLETVREQEGGWRDLQKSDKSLWAAIDEPTQVSQFLGGWIAAVTLGRLWRRYLKSRFHIQLRNGRPPKLRGPEASMDEHAWRLLLWAGWRWLFSQVLAARR